MVLLVEPCVAADFLEPGECARLTALFDSSPDIVSARLAGGIDNDIRVCRSLWIDDLADTQWVFARLVRLASTVNRERFGFDLEDFREGVQIVRYDAPIRGHAAGHYDAHVDIGGSGHSASRKLSISVQLSAPDAYTGGALQIDIDGAPWSAPREPGTAILFPSFVRHRVAPVDSGTRYALVAWMHGPAFR